MAVLRDGNGPYANQSASDPITYQSETDYDEMGPASEYVAPGDYTDAPYNDEFGWARGLAPEDVARPMPPEDGFHGDDDRWRPFWRRRDADDAARHSVETQDANGWDDSKTDRGAVGNRFANSPYYSTPAETRPTALLAPTSYSFTRPFEQLWERRNNGIHFSLADHRRNYEVMGMTPMQRGRNTYRLDPPQWDTDIVDVPPPYTVPNRRVEAIDLPPSGNRSWRVGG